MIREFLRTKLWDYYFGVSVTELHALLFFFFQTAHL